MNKRTSTQLSFSCNEMVEDIYKKDLKANDMQGRCQKGDLLD
jgi:hypothetical protein